MKPRIILLSGEKLFTKFIYNGLKDTFNIDTVIFEESEDPKIVYERRKKKVGFIKAYGQSLFDKYAIKRLIRSSKDRLKEIVKINKLDASKIPEEKIKLVRSVNDVDTISLIRSIDPEIIIVNNTRILKKDLLNSVKGHFINIHSGMLPEYRGYSGGYWALVNKDKQKCGSTIHFVDEGIDTGSIICQGVIDVVSEDNYFTYSFLHLAKEIELLKKAISDISNNNFEKIKSGKKEKLRHGPTLWGYLFNRIVKNVK